MVTFGIDHVENYEQWLKGVRVGLLTNITGRDSRNRSTIDVLRKICTLTALFAPEHGVRGDVGAGETVTSYQDAATGLTVYSLYGSAGKHFSQEMLDAFDVLVYDIQDVGVRFFTYISSLYNALTDCARAGKALIVLDRPNPLGDLAEGGVLDPAFGSFVGCYPFAVRYGLTCGEAASMMNQEQKLGCDLRIVPCGGWRRDSLFSQWGIVWQAPSPALMTFETALLYPGVCLVEGTNLSEGRGTAAPFRVIGGNYVNAEELTEAFNREMLPGVTSTPVWFTPAASKHQGEKCGGIVLHVTDQERIRPVMVGITLLDVIRKLYPEKYAVLPPYREGGRPMLALLSGSDVLLGDWDRDQVLARFERESKEFAERKREFHRYR
ncbi:MAG: DUF1343 domain-containing protein [Lachnospiraceae bacterium]|jgi:uncharacterized protein YbbC (DUF1343 family)|nr:DUF1343 domain-containing protein [Lachnospiraceae bacterium]